MRWFMRLFRRDRLERELDAELRHHVDEEARRLEREGTSSADARRQALAAFGGLEPVKEQARDARGTRWLGDLAQDLKYGVRMLWRSRGFTAAAVVSLAIGIGANAAMFSVADGLLLRSLPVKEPENLVFLNRAGREEQQNMRFSHPAFLRMQKAVPSARFAARSAVVRLQLARSGSAELVLGELVSGEWFDVLGIEPAAGRLFTPDDTREIGANRVAVLSHQYWTRQFGGDRNVIGTTLRANGVPLTIVGVAAPGFSGVTVGSKTDVWVPLTLQHDLRHVSNASMDDADGRKPWVPQDGIAWLTLVARLPSREAEREVASGVAAVHRRALEERAKSIEDPEERTYQLRERVELVPASRGLSPLRDSYTEPLQVLLVTTAVVLLIGCANLASLLMARGSARHRELALRLSLGAGRGRIVRQLVTESVLLACIGGVAALAVARWGGQALLRLAATGPTPIPLDLPFDWRFLGFTAAVSLITGLAFGLAPALRLSRPDLVEAMKAGRRVTGEADRPTRVPFGKALVVLQVTLALALLVGALLFLRTFRNLLSIDTGLGADEIVTARFDPRMAGFERDAWPALFDRVLTEARRIPGARSATLSMMGALTGGARTSSGIVVEGQPRRLGPEGDLREEYVGPSYFATMGMSVVRGRDFRSLDNPASAKVAVINEAMARRFFGDVNPIGKHFGYDTPPDVEIVGVVRDARIDGLRQPVPPMAYRLLEQYPEQFATNIAVRVAGSGTGVKTALTRAIAAAEPNLAIRDVSTIGEMAERTVARERLVSQLTAAFGLLAVAVACLGLYATVSYSVVRRTNEIGVRLALGASPSNLRWLVLRETMLLVGLGIAGGILLVIPTFTFIGALLFGLSPRDPATIAGAAACLLVLGALAGLIPAWRASRVDPITALRAE
jgi:predicted permease